MSFNPFESDLPITYIIPEVQKKLYQDNTLIVNAPPGAGKSTILPLSLIDEPWLKGQKILMLEPRRLAARSIAVRMSELLGDEVGKTVGYRIRFENRTSNGTRIEVLTEGILTRMIHTDNSLDGVGLVIFDEFHERSIHADVALALCREAQQILRPDLRIMVMSATLDMPQLTELLKAPVAESKGRQYPVEIVYTGEQDQMMLPEMTARTVLRAVRENEGDTLVFLPGEGEIKKCEEALRRELPQFAIHPLYGKLPQNKQYAAIMPNKNGQRKVVLATSIAETSLTIEGIKIVVDTGYGRTSRFDPKSGLSRLETIQISQDSADQRAGRAGRLSAGVCYRMWSKATHERLAGHRTPEIMEADLADLVLDLAQWGIVDARQLTWLTPPPKAALSQASDTLHQLDALENGRITPHGKKIHQLPCHPRIAHMLMMAEEDDMLALATDIAALLEERDPLPRESGIDLNLRIEALRRYRQRGSQGKPFARIEKIASSYRKMFNIKEDNSPVDPYATGVLLAHAHPERIAYARPGNNAQFQLANGKYAMAGHKDDLAHEPWLAIANVDARDGMGKIFMASPLNPKDLAPLVKEQEVITWDTRKGGLIATKDLRIGCIVLQSRPLPSPDEKHLIKAISEAVKDEGENLLSFDEAVTQWQNRVLSLRRWNPQEGWPDVSTSTLLITNEEWLTPYLANIKKPEDLKKIDLVNVLHHSLDWEKQQALTELAPERIEVPSGSSIRLQYMADGAPPVLAVRLQEVFGLADTPRINNGKNAVIIHLLSPGFKPVQITSDLRSFWNNAYFEVKKELQRRYPKHSWPDDPWTAEALRGVKKK
ncbi:ATP-dependent helicase HrpB [Fulvivirga imtechensis AK7]|uniref:ATP-dependent helicase HrpB n=1 Tax=Fulvivirga imtechensis AK7 TaxID=1237149 RepID=L8JWZ7_9BACT|nr:ATP-dependent helicase HrpB [Fulvivirga imtechensis]ELR73601.1 ATP-dependent helicase HrpB [Fulvivirga imtechensis AK7]